MTKNQVKKNIIDVLEEQYSVDIPVTIEEMDAYSTSFVDQGVSSNKFYRILEEMIEDEEVIFDGYEYFSCDTTRKHDDSRENELEVIKYYEEMGVIE